MITLRNYQQRLINDLRSNIVKGNKKVIMQLATGGGKTIIFTYMALRHIEKSPFNRVLILTDRTELLKQSGNTFNKFNASAERISPNHNYNLEGQLFVGMIETVFRRKKKLEPLLKKLTLVIIDEAHKGNFTKLLSWLSEYNPKCIVLGATATPISTKGNRLDILYNKIVCGVEIKKLIESGNLASYRHFAPDLKLDKIKVTAGEYNAASLYDSFNRIDLYKNTVEFYRRYAEDKKTLIFCVNIEHSEKTYKKFLEKEYHNCRVLTSKNTPEYRKETLEWFENTSNAILINCGILTTGYDCPSIECIILNRATLSLPLYMQMIGRGARTTANKKSFTVIDLGNNVNRFGRWDSPIKWENKFYYNENKKNDGIAPIKMCPSCEAINHASAKECAECKTIFPIKEKNFIEVNELKEIQPIKNYAELPKHLQKSYKDMEISELLERAQYGSPHTGKPYKKMWIVNQLKKKQNPRKHLEEYAKINGYSKKWVGYQLRNY